MREYFYRGMVALAAAALVAAGPRAGAQTFGLSATASAGSLLVNTPLTYTINVTNLGITLSTAFVTNQLPPSVQFQSASPAGFYTTNGGVVVFNVGAYFGAGFPSGLSVALSLTVQPTATGPLTNLVTVSSFDGPNTASTNVVVIVTNAVTLADLGVAVAGPAQPVVITNDWLTYTVMATNLGPNTATGVALTNTLPPGVTLLSAAPANYTIAASNLVFNLGTLAAGAGASFQFTIQPTNPGVLALSASIGSAVLDTNTANNFAGTNVIVTNYLSGPLAVFTNSPQITNFLNGLLEQGVTVSNTGPPLFAARVILAGLTNQLFNAVGTNNGNPFVVCVAPPGAPLAGGQTVKLLLQYFPRKLFPFTNSQLQAFAVPVPNLAPPAGAAAGTNVNITRILRLSNGRMLIEWPALTHRTYTVVYSDNVSFSNAMIAPPSIFAQANDLEWFDYGPPATVSAPANSSARFYRVYLNP